MAKVSVLVDTDIFIDYFNSGRFSPLFDSSRFTLYYSIITKKELLAKSGLRDSERESILTELRRCRLIMLSDSITARYTELRRRHPSLEKGDALIAATALVKRLPLLTRNRRHFQVIPDLVLFGE
ncbi:MAG: PIN domain-containing protein [Nitrospira sp.]|nr:PIN domain-containing protein [Nitrospira sp.]MDH5626567.1 PIN domain-containing protein [Nitrospira sp.]